MCGRFTQRFSWREVHRFMNLTGPALNLRPRYNVAPGQDVAAVRAQDGERRLSMLRWGLIPVWSRQPNIAYRLINARAETVETCTILTTAANETVAPIHERMPAVLPPESFDAWLGGQAVALGPCPAHEMTVRAVGTWVNKPAHDDPRCIEALRAPIDDGAEVMRSN